MWARNLVLRRLRLSVDPGNVARRGRYGKSWRGAPIVRWVQFDHVALRVPDVAAALAWWSATVPGAEVLYADATWGLLAAGGARIAFVVAEQHPDHLAFKVSGSELKRLAAVHGV